MDNKDLIRRSVKVFVRWFNTERFKEKKNDKPPEPESWESKRDKFRLFVRVVIEAIKIGKLKELYVLVLSCLEAKLNWDDAIARLNGEYYGRQIKEALEEFRIKHPEYFKEATVRVPGYEKWKKEVENES